MAGIVDVSVAGVFCGVALFESLLPNPVGLDAEPFRERISERDAGSCAVRRSVFLVAESLELIRI